MFCFCVFYGNFLAFTLSLVRFISCLFIFSVFILTYAIKFSAFYFSLLFLFFDFTCTGEKRTHFGTKCHIHDDVQTHTLAIYTSTINCTILGLLTHTRKKKCIYRFDSLHQTNISLSLNVVFAPIPVHACKFFFDLVQLRARYKTNKNSHSRPQITKKKKKRTIVMCICSSHRKTVTCFT